MKKPNLSVTWTILIVALSAMPALGEDKGATALFDGKTLKGWEQRNGTAKYRVENGTIVGTTNEGSPNSFLCTKKNYSDFELLFEVKVDDDQLNSGVQIRSRSTRRNSTRGRVHGPQVEIATNGTAGFVYGEALGTGWLERRIDPTSKAQGRLQARVNGTSIASPRCG